MTKEEKREKEEGMWFEESGFVKWRPTTINNYL